MVQCKLCGSADVTPVLKNRPDFEFNVAQKLNYYKCGKPSCGLVFAAPLPSDAEIASFYQQYTTHRPNLLIRPLRFLSYLYRVSYISQLKGLFKGYNLGEVKVLDFGCGNGNLMKDLSRVGVQHLLGYDFDAHACEAAAKEGLYAVSDKKEIEKRGPFDFIFLNHVVEHLSDPRSDIAYLCTLLKRGGRVVIRTPNTNSLLASLFKDGWRGWETPRHLHVFNNRNIRSLFPDMHIQQNATSNFIFSGVFNESFHSDFFRKTWGGKLLRKVMFILLFPVSLTINFLFSNKGEEICLIAQKQH